MASRRPVLALAALAMFGGCSLRSGGGDDVAVGTLAITPADATVTLAVTAGGYTATQAFAVIATETSGTASDVTARVEWTIDDPHLSIDARGVATVVAAGRYVLAAQFGVRSATTTLTATLASASARADGDDFLGNDDAKRRNTNYGR